MKKYPEFAKQLGSDFKPNTRWLGRFLKRKAIKFKRAHGEKKSTDIDSAKKWLAERLPDILATYSEEEIYNADETGLFYRATPDATLCFAKEQLSYIRCCFPLMTDSPSRRCLGSRTSDVYMANTLIWRQMS